MIDTIGGSKVSKISIEKILKKLDFVSQIEDKTGKITVNADLKIGHESPVYFRFRISEDFISFNGSLAQFYNESHKSLRWFDVKDSITKLEDLTELKLDDSKLYRTDLEGTFPLPNPVFQYFDFLGIASGNLNRNMRSDSLTYSNKGSKSIKLYDKKKRVEKRTETSMEGVDYLARFEVSYTQHLKNLQKVHGFEKKLYSLAEPKVQSLLTNLWIKEYSQILKYHPLSFDPKIIKTGSDVTNALKSLGVNHLGGLDRVVKMIKEMPNMDSKSTYNMKKSIEKSYLRSNGLTNSTFIEELNIAICFSYLLNTMDISSTLAA